MGSRVSQTLLVVLLIVTVVKALNITQSNEPNDDVEIEPWYIEFLSKPNVNLLFGIDYQLEKRRCE